MRYRYVVLYDFKIYDVTIKDYGDLITVDLDAGDYQVYYTNSDNGVYESLEVCVPVACADEHDNDDRINDYMYNVESILQLSVVLFEEISEGEGDDHQD